MFNLSTSPWVSVVSCAHHQAVAACMQAAAISLPYAYMHAALDKPAHCTPALKGPALGYQPGAQAQAVSASATGNDTGVVVAAARGEPHASLPRPSEVDRERRRSCLAMLQHY